MIKGYFESDEWPYREKSNILGPDIMSRTRMTCVIDTGVSPLGCILWLLFTIVSFGLAIVVWLWYWFVERDGFLPQVVVTAFPESSGMSKVTVISQKREKPQEMPEFTEPVTQWIQRELVEKRRAATEVPEVAPTTSGDIPD